MIVDDNSARVSKADYPWRKDNPPPLPKGLRFEDSTPVPAAVAENQPQTQAPKTGFFKLHYRIFSSGYAAQIGTRPFVFYCWLLSEVNSLGERTFRASDERIARETGISPTSLAEYRTKLMAQGLIECSRGPSQSYQYTVKDSLGLDLQRKPMQDKPRKIGKARGRSIAKQNKPREEMVDGLPRIMFELPTKYAVPATVFGK